MSRIRWLFVIARNSTFVYKNRAVDVKQVARELGVRYVLEGSVRRAGKQAAHQRAAHRRDTGGHHWAERYDRELGDIFAVQDEITRSVVGRDRTASAGRGGRSRAFALGRRSRRLGACGARANSCLAPDARRLRDCDRRTQTGRRGLSGLRAGAKPAGFLPGVCRAYGMGRSRSSTLAGREHAVRAIALDDHYPWGHIALGYSAMMERRTEESIAAFRRAVNLNPNSAAAHCHLSHGLAFAGQDREAIEHAEEAIRLSPLDPEMALFLGGIAVAHYTAGRYAEAVRYSTELFDCARVSREHNVCAVRVWPRWAKSMKPGNFLNGAARAAPAIDRLDQSERALSNTGVDGALSRGHAESGAQ